MSMSILKKVALVALITLVNAAMSFAQPVIRQLQRDCPYDTTRPPCTATGITGCNIPNYQFRYQQDCCGAIRLCTDTNTVYNQGGTSVPGSINAAICGEGCKPSEISTSSCLSSSENNTSWYVFEIKPLKDGGTRRGDFAGYLRMKILPCDIPPNPASCTSNCNCDAVNSSRPQVFNDNGNNSIGNTDYDWIIYDISGFPRKFDLTRACPLITNAVNVGDPWVPGRPIVRSCNYSAKLGPTGLYDPGSLVPGSGDSTLNFDGIRYNTPFPVYVGQRFVLAVDNFSNNPTGYKIDFTGRGNRFRFPPQFNIPDPYPTATVVPPSGSIELDTAIDVSTCTDNIIKIRFNRAVPYDSINVTTFKIENPSVPPVTILSIKPDPADTVLGFARKFIIRVNNLYSGDRFKLIQTYSIKDPCGNQDQLDTTLFSIRPFTYFDTASQVCQNPSNPPRFGNDLNTYTVRSKINEKVSFVPSEYQYSWKIFAGLSGTDSLFVPLTSNNDSITLIPPVLNANPALRKGPGFSYRPGSSNGNYRLALRLIANINTGLCLDSARISVLVKYKADLIPDTVSVCFGDLIRINLNPSDTIGRKITWQSAYRPNWAYAGGNLNYPSDTVAYDLLNIKIDDRRTGCTYFTTPFPVYTAQKYLPDFDLDTLSQTQNSFPMTVRFNNKTKRVDRQGNIVNTGYKGLSFKWGMGNGDFVYTNNAQSAVYTFQAPPTIPLNDLYGITLEVLDTLALRPTPSCFPPLPKQEELVVRKPFVPNFISSASRDGLNDIFDVSGISKEASLTFFNRYGVQVYHVDNYKSDFSFDSKLKGGIYYYLIKDGLTGQQSKGWVQVVQ